MASVPLPPRRFPPRYAYGRKGKVETCPKAVVECLDAVYAALRHGVDLLQERATGHPTGPRETTR